MVLSISDWASALRSNGATAVDQYEEKLRSFGSNSQKVFEMLSEARAAIMFLRAGVGVTMRDKPDLFLEFNGQQLYAEVKHFNWKATDTRDEETMRARPLEFVRVGNVVDDEGKHQYEQMCSIAMRKVSQYMAGFPNILVFVNHSPSVDLMLQSAVNEYDDEVRKPGANPDLRKLSGMMMLGTIARVGFGGGNIDLQPTRYAYRPLSYAFGAAMGQIQFA
jgi:hypothetical protein